MGEFSALLVVVASLLFAARTVELNLLLVTDVLKVWESPLTWLVVLSPDRRFATCQLSAP